MTCLDITSLVGCKQRTRGNELGYLLELSLLTPLPVFRL
eukprot:SAG31_NODE_22807_length_517_cov_0.995215_2_plen_38_part_01